VEANLQAQSTKGEGGEMPHGGEHAIASTAADGGHGEAPHVDPTALGLNATAWVALAMLVVIGLMLWKKVPAAIGRALDKKIAAFANSSTRPRSSAPRRKRFAPNMKPRRRRPAPRRRP
jgi:hypothetical protein